MTRFINCEVCQTEGRLLTNDGGPDDVDHGVCPECKGERVVEVEDEPVDPEHDEEEKPGTKTYFCINRCDDYQNIRTNNPFANCGRCGSRLVPINRIEQMQDDSGKRARIAYEAFRGGLISGLDPDVPRWEDAPSWIRDVAVVAYLQGKLDAPRRS